MAANGGGEGQRRGPAGSGAAPARLRRRGVPGAPRRAEEAGAGPRWEERGEAAAAPPGAGRAGREACRGSRAAWACPARFPGERGREKPRPLGGLREVRW